MNIWNSCDEGTLEWVNIDDVLRLNLWEGDRVFLRLLRERDSFFSLKLTYDDNGNLIDVMLDGYKSEL